MITAKMFMWINNDVSGFITGGRYEKIVLSVLNESKTIFPFSYVHIEKQPNGEPDYICVENGQKFELN